MPAGLPRTLAILHLGRNRIRFRNPTLPNFLEAISIFNLKLGDSRVDLRLERHADDVTVKVLRRVGDAQVALLK